jgi:hypothetical protein
MKKIRDYVNKNLGIDSSKLSDEDVKKLAIFYLRASSYETPRFAKADALELGLTL